MSQGKQLPEFENEDDLAAWIESHDTSEYMDQMIEATDEIEVLRTRFSTKPLDVRLRTEYLEAIEELAERRGLPYQALVQRWLLERLTQEAPDLMTK
ncbi:CopG family antitoxin [Promineifilum sp.]|uniref:CopG family antitoxin n=1 Tax=Promineifilum sp. TaxID=2664178 RepID=UPI0035B1D293